MQRHRLALLLGILVALVFFYLGINTWMESQQIKTAPPPVVRAKPPVQVKPPAQPVKPVEPPKVEEKVTVATNSPPLEEKPNHPKEPTNKDANPKDRVKNLEKPRDQAAEKPKEKKPKVKVQKPKKEAKPEKPLKDYVVQIGAFKSKENAQKRLKEAKEDGFDAFLIEEEGLYKVRIRIKAENFRVAISKVRKTFKNAFVVR